MRIDEIRERAEKAESGPWEIERFRKDAPPYLIARPHSTRVVCVFGSHERIRSMPREDQEGNAQFIAHAREDIPYLLDRIKGLEGLMDAMTDDQKKAVTEWLEKARRGMGGVIETRHFPCESCTALSEARREVEECKEIEDSLQEEIARLDGIIRQSAIFESRAEKAEAEVAKLKDAYRELEWGFYRPLKKGEITRTGDQVLLPDEDAEWEDTDTIREVPDPIYPAHCQYRRPILQELRAEREEAVKALREIVANHTLNGVVATMFCQGCIDDFETAQEALLTAKEVEDE